MQKNEKERSLLWLSAAISVVLMIVVFKAARRFPGDEHIFMVGDYFVQFMNYIVMFWRKLLSGNGILYSFDVGLGAATLEQYAFYGFSPFNFVFVIIKNTDIAAFVLFLLKVAAIASSMHLFLRQAIKLKECTSLFFSISYALCAYVMNYYFCIVLIDYLYMLPIVMLMLVRFFRTGKWYGLAFTYGVTFTIAYYGGYMIGIFSFVCFICMLLTGKCDIDKKKIVKLFFVAVTIAVMISAVVTLPTAAAIISGHGGNAYKGVELRLFIWDIIADMYPLRKIGVNSVLPSVYSGLPVLFFVMAYFRDTTRGIRVRIIGAIPLIFLSACSVIEPFYIMMHGFDAPDGYHFRFAYLFAFYMILLAAIKAKENCMSLDKKTIIIVAAVYPLVVFLGKLTLPEDVYEMDTLRMGLVELMIVAYYFTFLSKIKNKSVLIGTIFVLELFTNAYFAITPDKQTLIRWKETYDLWLTQGEKAITEIEAQEEDDEFYRINYRDGMWNNDSMFFGFHGLGYFSSMEQVQTRKTLKKLGYSTSDRVVVERGGSPFTEMIFAQKYRVKTCPDIRLDDPEKVDVEKNIFSLPLGFMVSDNICNLGDLGNNAFINQQLLLESMTEDSGYLWEEYTGDIVRECENAEIEISSDETVIKRKEPGTASITLTIPSKDKKAYSYFPSDSSALDWASPIVSSDEQADNIGIVAPVFLQMPSLVPLGDKNGKSRLYITFRDTTGDSAIMERVDFAYLDEQVIKRAFDELEPGGLKIISMRDDRIKGIIKADGDKSVLFTSIPYEKGWHIKIDGKKIKTFSVVEGAFLAGKVDKGEHEVEIYYENAYIKAGLVISFFGMLILLTLILRDIQINCKKSQKNFT